MSIGHWVIAILMFGSIPIGCYVSWALDNDVQ